MRFSNKIVLLLVVISLVTFSGVSFADDYSTWVADPGSNVTQKTELRQYDLDHGKDLLFSHLAKSTYVTCVLGTNVIAPNDTTSTGTSAVSWLGGSIKPPFMVRVQEIGGNGVAYLPYDVDSTFLTVDQTTASCPTLVTENNVAWTSKSKWEKVFFSDPNLVFGAGPAASCSIVIQVWTKGY